MTWQDWVVAAIGVAIVAWGVVRIVRNIKKRRSLFDPCASCSEKDCPSRGSRSSECEHN